MFSPKFKSCCELKGSTFFFFCFCFLFSLQVRCTRHSVHTQPQMYEKMRLHAEIIKGKVMTKSLPRCGYDAKKPNTACKSTGQKAALQNIFVHTAGVEVQPCFPNRYAEPFYGNRKYCGLSPHFCFHHLSAVLEYARSNKTTLSAPSTQSCRR